MKNIIQKISFSISIILSMRETPPLNYQQRRKAKVGSRAGANFQKLTTIITLVVTTITIRARPRHLGLARPAGVRSVSQPPTNTVATPATTLNFSPRIRANLGSTTFSDPCTVQSNLTNRFSRLQICVQVRAGSSDANR